MVLLVLTGFIHVSGSQVAPLRGFDWLLAEAMGPGVSHYPASYPWLVPVVDWQSSKD